MNARLEASSVVPLDSFPRTSPRNLGCVSFGKSKIISNIRIVKIFYLAKETMYLKMNRVYKTNPPDKRYSGEKLNMAANNYAILTMFSVIVLWAITGLI